MHLLSSRIVLDPVYPSPDPGHSRKYAINEIPQEIKFTLVFDEEIDKHLLAAAKKMNTDKSGFIATIPEEVIESDEESDLNEGEEEAIAEEEAKKGL